MKPIGNYKFIDKATANTVSNVYTNTTCDVLGLQIDGTFTSASVILEGKTDVNAEWQTLAVVDLKDFNVVSEMSAKGIFEAGIECINLVRVTASNIVGGNLTVFGRFGQSVAI